MPHQRSYFGRRRDFLRGVSRGYILRSDPAGAVHHRACRADQVSIVVPRAIADRVRIVAASLAVHKRDCDALGRQVHFAGAANAALRGFKRHEQYMVDRRLHRRVGIARHVWRPRALRCGPWPCSPPGWTGSLPPAAVPRQIQDNDSDLVFASCIRHDEASDCDEVVSHICPLSLLLGVWRACRPQEGFRSQSGRKAYRFWLMVSAVPPALWIC